jgi:hypothetical protein
MRIMWCLLCMSCCYAAETVVSVDWSSKPLKVASTASTVEVDVMPFLGRTTEGGPFGAYFEALSNLGSDYVRYAPWYPYPKVVVPELDPPDCTATKPATNWNSTLFDGIMRDFMAAVCGPDAATGACTHSVAQQLSTMPDWLYVDGYPVPPGVINPDPWEFNKFEGYDRGSALIDETCADMASYMGRLVEHYTAGGHHDRYDYSSVLFCTNRLILVHSHRQLRPLAPVRFALQLGGTLRTERERAQHGGTPLHHVLRCNPHRSREGQPEYHMRWPRDSPGRAGEVHALFHRPEGSSVFFSAFFWGVFSCFCRWITELFVCCVPCVSTLIC